MYHLLRDGVEYQELGRDYLDKLQPQRLPRYLVKRLESLGQEMTLPPVDGAALPGVFSEQFISQGMDVSRWCRSA